MGKNIKFSLEDLLKEVNLQTKTAEESEKKEESKAEEKKEEKKEDMKEEKKEKKEEEKKEASPIADAMKLAEKLASMEKEVLQKEAELLGKAICDGFVTRMHQYEKSAAHVKTANEPSLDMEKIASAYNNDPDFKASFDQGYMDKVAEEIEKNPEAKRAFIEGYEKTASELIKVAEHMRDKGYTDCGKAIAKCAQSY